MIESFSEMGSEQHAQLAVIIDAARREEAALYVTKFSTYPRSRDCQEHGLAQHKLYGACAWCCGACDTDRHICHFCGENLNHNHLERGPAYHSCTTDCVMCGVHGHEHYDDPNGARKFDHPWTPPDDILKVDR